MLIFFREKLNFLTLAYVRLQSLAPGRGFCAEYADQFI
jgi:hypothetical protein